MTTCQNFFTFRKKIGDHTFSALGFGLLLSFELKKRLFVMLLKNPQMQGSRSAFHLPIRQAIPRIEAYLQVRRNDEG